MFNNNSSSHHIMTKAVLDKLTPPRVRQLEETMKNNLNSMLTKKETTELQAKFIKELINYAKSNYIIFPNFIPSEPGIGLMEKNKKAIMHVALNNTDKKFLKHYGSPFILELLHLHSFSKGEGRKLMEAYLQLHKNLNIPGSLWAESLEKVKYFEKYGFENLGKLGKNAEYLMKLAPSLKQ